MPKPVLSAEARRDLRGIQEYIADEQENPKTALKVIEKILDKIENLFFIDRIIHGKRDYITILFPS